MPVRFLVMQLNPLQSQGHIKHPPRFLLSHETDPNIAARSEKMIVCHFVSLCSAVNSHRQRLISMIPTDSLDSYPSRREWTS